ncbi:hypothetical protein [Maricaulis parjimensis]|uniref:hypothetical protein n=1 Tax=Maricaulis parjimensis TaxID=144023 RepID=UPI00193AC41B|nr:hypothetical protein [Maricaulis parjimensis]
MRHRHRPSRVATFVAEAVNVRQMQTTTEALQRSNRRAVLVSDQHALLRGYNGQAELNFAVAEQTENVDPAGHDALILMEGAAKLADSASGLARRFMEAGKPVIALTGSAGIISALVGNDAPAEQTASALVNGQLYQITDEDADWKILNAIGERLDAERGLPAAANA